MHFSYREASLVWCHIVTRACGVLLPIPSNRLVIFPCIYSVNNVLLVCHCVSLVINSFVCATTLSLLVMSTDTEGRTHYSLLWLPQRYPFLLSYVVLAVLAMAAVPAMCLRVSLRGRQLARR